MVHTWSGDSNNNYKAAHKTGGFLGLFKSWESWKMYGYEGDDTLIGGPKNDNLYGSYGNDRLYGQDGHDYLSGGSGNDYLSGGRDNDTLYGGSGHDSMYGGEGNDYMSGSYGNDYLSGGSGNDTMYGGSDRDTMYGGSGKDKIVGGYGNDYLHGGDGADKFVFNNKYEGIDTIADFDWDEGDKIQVSKSGFGASSTYDFSYNSSNGSLSFKGHKFATIANKPAGFNVHYDIDLV